MKKASIYLNREMADFVIREFALNDVEYSVKYDYEKVGEDIISKIEYDTTDPFIGNYIFIAGAAFINEYYKRIGHKITGENIINSALNKKDNESNY